MNNSKVNVLMATYNGARHIKAQLDSIINQTYDNIEIVIRDDGSTDDTVSIIQEYIRENKSMKKITLLDNNGKNLGCPYSFYEIFKQCEPAEYYSLCDQDDIWLPEKIAWAVERLERESKEEALVYYTACEYCDEEGKRIRLSHRQKEKLTLSDVLFYTPGSGFTIVVNEKAREKLILQAELGPELHDRWLIRGGVCFGKVLYDERISAKHVRHESAVTAGDSGNSNLFLYFLQSELRGEEAKKEKEALRFFAETFAEKLSTEEKKILDIFTKENTFFGWFQKVFYPKRLRARWGGEMALRFLFLIGRI